MSFNGPRNYFGSGSLSCFERLVSLLKTLLISGLCLLPVACGQNQQQTLRIGTNVWPGYEPLYLARSLHYFDNKQIQLVEFSSASQTIRAFRNGSIDAAALTLDEVLLLLQGGLSPRIVLTMDISHGGDVILGQAGMQTLQAIKGKRVGVEGRALGAYVLTRALQQNNMSIEEIQPVILQIDEHEQAFKQGKVDAVVTFEPIKSKLLASGAAQLFDSSMIPGEIVDVLVVRDGYLQQNKSQVRELIKQWYQSLSYMSNKPDAAAAIMAKRLGLTPKQVLASYQGLKLPDREENYRMLSGGGNHPGLLGVSENLVQVMKEHDLLHGKMDSSVLFLSDVEITFLHE